MYKLIGFNHRKGTSAKTGNEYDFYQCSFVVPYQKGYDAEGFEALVLNVSPELFLRSDAAGHLNADCELRFSRYGRLVDLIFK